MSSETSPVVEIKPTKLRFNMSPREIGGLIGVVVLIVGTLYVAQAHITDNTSRIATLEAIVKADHDLIVEIHTDVRHILKQHQE